MTEVTIIIPNYNGKKLLENCIKTLERQTCQEFKLLVIDNGSKDGSTDVTSESLYMEMVALPENTGFCGAVNLGFEMTTTPYAILLNNDTEAEPHFVEELLKGIRQSERNFPNIARECENRFFSLHAPPQPTKRAANRHRRSAREKKRLA